MINKPGPKLEERRAYYIEKFKLNEHQQRDLTRQVVKWLDGCADDMARRILLGITEKFTPEEQAALGL